MSISSRDKLIFAGIYLVVLVFMLWYNIGHKPVNDGLLEYNTFKANYAEGWTYREDNILNSCIITTWIPAITAKVTGWDPYYTFRIFPCLFYALMPAFVYLISRRYLGVLPSLVATGLLFSSSYIVFFPDMGRVGVAWGLLAGMIWALLEKRWWWSLIFAALIVFSHYGTSLIAAVVAGVLLASNLIIKKKLIKQFLTVTILLVVLTLIWHVSIAESSGDYMGRSIVRTGNSITSTSEWLDLEEREPVLQEAFGLNYTDMNTPQRIELYVTWIVLLVTLVGFCIMMYRKYGDFNTRVLAGALIGLTIFTAIVPWLSLHYGAQRIYFTALIVVAPCLFMAAKWATSNHMVLAYIFSGYLLVPYFLSVSGLIYLPFGVSK